MSDKSYSNQGVYNRQGGKVMVVANDGAIKVEGAGSIGVAASIATVATPASGTCGVQFTFLDADGVAIAVPVSALCYQSTDPAGLAESTAISSIAVLTNGAYTSLVTGKIGIFTTTAAGLLGLTLTASAGTYYMVFVMPSGAILVSSALVVN